MHTVSSGSDYTTEVNRSKFIAYLVPISEYSGLQEKLKKENPKANHVVYALRYFNEYDQVVENFSDDNEPKGCAGMPALNVLRGNEMVNCAVLIVRYFGGIKLGTGGMARAYALAVKNVIEKGDLTVYEKVIEYAFHTSYRDVEKTLYKLKQLGIREFERDFGVEEVKWGIRGSEEKVESFKNM